MQLKTPKHIAIIMDGNGRWAKLNNRPRIFGHKKGVDRVNQIVEYCVENDDIEILTLYTFSSENWLRPKLEVKKLMELIVSTVNKEINNLIGNGIKVSIIGDISNLPKLVQKTLEGVMESTKDNNRLILNLAINYGSKQEILNSIQLILNDIINNKIELKDVDMNLFESKLYTYPHPDPDLLIRTGGEFRLSNFLLWQLAYSEIIVNSKFWPDYSKEDFVKDIHSFMNRERRFGKISEQIN
ncbi:MAG: di-trans,poly-cis-decaprenylcistransferase [Candidatus Marinimicrobia bacterium]|nr:di-trans,poly-cis-decaprenylcistransferase [Candidatus Neomarinimicrobiota bacterium]|tara:strand:+ start:12062 stop:12784 length:723 start_codon:yes stop_codon:yes gene_type:complete